MMSGASTVIRRPPGWSPAPFRGLVILAGARGGTSAPADEDAADSVSVSDALLVPVLASIGDSVALAEAVAEFRAVLAADAVTLSEAAQAVLAAANSTSDQVATSDVIRAGFAQVTADTVAITDVAGLASSIAATITDLLAAAEALDQSIPTGTEEGFGMKLQPVETQPVMAQGHRPALAPGVDLKLRGQGVGIQGQAVVAHELQRGRLAGKQAEAVVCHGPGVAMHGVTGLDQTGTQMFTQRLETQTDAKDRNPSRDLLDHVHQKTGPGWCAGAR